MRRLPPCVIDRTAASLVIRISPNALPEGGQRIIRRRDAAIARPGVASHCAVLVGVADTHRYARALRAALAEVRRQQFAQPLGGGVAVERPSRPHRRTRRARPRGPSPTRP